MLGFDCGNGSEFLNATREAYPPRPAAHAAQRFLQGLADRATGQAYTLTPMR